MTPNPAPEEPIDPVVRSLLWRLRARLVTPPDQKRTSDDLDRLFAAAQEHAHGPELAPEVIRIIPSVTGGGDDELSATGTGAYHPFTVDQEDDAPVPAGVTPLHARRYRMTTMVSRVAAAAVLVVAVGGGFATTRDGNGLTIQALLGRGASEPAEPDTLAGGSAGDVADELDFDAADLPEPRPVPLPAEDDDAEAADDPDDADDSAEVADAPDDSATTPAPRDIDDAPSRSNDDADEVSEAPEEAPVEAPTDEILAAPAPAQPPAPAPVEPVQPPSVPERAPVDEVVAPPPSEVVGTGGPTPCREDEDLTSCFERRTTEEEPADSEAPVDDADVVEPTDPTTDGSGDDAAAREALAKRRGS